MKTRNKQPPLNDQLELSRLSLMYSEFVSVLDDMPPSLQSSVILLRDNESPTEYQPISFTTQRYRLQTMFYCAKLLVVHECIRFELPSIIGLHNDRSASTREELNIARDFVHTLQSVPFHYLRGNGEPGIELIRAVGSVLLEISQNSNDESHQQRGHTLLNIILNILAKLNSQASDKLIEQLSNTSVASFPSSMSPD
ncbi:unnamed protein product [Clonostachys solani]|uniref:Uncharacterized protein n=1 Tax=Clonostachys solani TaxID=160281 RepID=A0A9P0ENB2_9HYPO|nr:unnamed protein product [Clonostachys solani]